jgi:hypothetical protein
MKSSDGQSHSESDVAVAENVNPPAPKVDEFDQISRDTQAPIPSKPSTKEMLAELRLAEGLARPRLSETITGSCALLAWTIFFAAGVLVSTKSYRDNLWGPESLSIGYWFRAMFVTFCSYTLTNLLFLACLSSYLGCMAMRWHVSQQSLGQAQFYSHIYPSRLYTSAVLRGFLLYLLIISGMLVIASESSMENTTPIQYVKIAGLVSVFGFIVGFDPQMVYRFLNKIDNVTSGSSSAQAKKE